jgi:hypothetical protein
MLRPPHGPTFHLINHLLELVPKNAIFVFTIIQADINENFNMKALVLEEYNKLVFKDVPDPEILSNEVLVKVKACGICGSDVHGLDGSTGRRIPPMIMGHEASGRR